MTDVGVQGEAGIEQRSGDAGNVASRSIVASIENWIPQATIFFAPYFYLRPDGFDFSSGTSLSLVDVGLLLLLGMIVNEQRRGNYVNMARLEYVWFGLAFVVSAIIAVLIGRQIGVHDTPLKLREFASCLSQYGFIFIAFPLIALRFFSEDLHRLIRWIALSYLPPMVIGIIFLSYDIPDNIRELFYSSKRAIGTYGNANSYASIIVMTLPYYVYMSVYCRGVWRCVGFIGQTACLVSLVLSGSISGILVLVAVAIIFLALVKKSMPTVRWRRILEYVLVGLTQFVIAGIVLLFYAPSALSDMFPRFMGIGDIFSMFWGPQMGASASSVVGASGSPSVVGASGSLRVELMFRSFTTIADHFGNVVWGVGLGNGRFSSLFTFGDVQLDVHNVYLLLWQEAGFVSMLLYLGFLAVMLVVIYRKGKSEAALAMAIGASVMGLGLYGLFNPHMYLRYYWIPLLPAFALARHYRAIK